ncbi:MAG: SrtB family sortase, partial [Coprobacillus sp.]
SDIIDAYSELYSTAIEYAKYIKDSLKGASVRTEVSEEEKPLIMLSTCYTTNSDDRNVLYARLREKVKPTE